MKLQSADLKKLLDLDLGPLKVPRKGTSTRDYAKFALRSSFLKKFRDDANQKADEAALRKFLSINDSCKNFAPVAYTPFDELLLGEFRQEVYRFVTGYVEHALNGPMIYRAGTMGPGTSLGTPYQDWYSKMYAGPLSCSSEGVYLLYKSWMQGDPRGLEAEEFRSMSCDTPEIASSKLGFVPKNTEISRTTCTEASVNMHGQLGVGNIIALAMRACWGLDLSNQPERNGRFAELGSLFDGTYCTIDLASASDTISLGLCHWAIPKSLLGWLLLLRSSSVDLPDGTNVVLHMVSTMGNGYTFPLQTMLFGCAVRAAYRLLGITIENPRGPIDREQDGNWGVFGDDIVCLKQAYNAVFRLLTLLGFKVNAEKSFESGDFRESCGKDFYQGVNVRAVYVKSLKRPQDRLALVNRLLEWSTDHNVALTNVLRALILSLERKELLMVPVHSGYDSGLRVPIALVSDLKCSINHKGSRKNLSHGYRYYHFLAPTLSVDEQGDLGLVGQRIYNPAGLLLALLHGSLRRCKIPLRPKSHDGKYVVRRNVTPSWGWRIGGFRNPDWERRWEASIVLLLRKTRVLLK